MCLDASGHYRMMPSIPSRINSVVTLYFLLFVENTVIKENKDRYLKKDPDFVKFYLYNNKSDWTHRQEIIFDSYSQQLPRLSINPELPTIIEVHGYLTRPLDAGINATIKNAHLSSPNKVNYISVDWTDLSNPRPFDETKYPLPVPWEHIPAGYSLVARRSVPLVGKRVGDFLLWILEMGVTSQEKIHGIGFSLGAHIIGIAAKKVRTRTGKKISRITGLDPAGPLFEGRVDIEQLSKEDANFVDVIHATSGVLAVREAIGHVDIYVNGGIKQPTRLCLPVSHLLPEPFCSHTVAQLAYAKAISTNVTACKCPNPLSLFEAQKCQRSCKEWVRLGPSMDRGATGKYALITVDLDWYEFKVRR